MRTHRWGPDGEAIRARFLTVASEEGDLLTVAAVRHRGARAHGEELVGGHTTLPATADDASALRDGSRCRRCSERTACR